MKVYVSNSFSEGSSLQFSSYYLDNELWILPWKPAFDIEKAASDGIASRGGSAGEWGSSSKYYIVRYVDFEMGKKLEKPLVTYFTVTAGLDAPEFRYTVDAGGRSRFYWDAVEGAESYHIGRITLDAGGDPMPGSFGIVHTTEGTSWDAFENTAMTRRETLPPSVTGGPAADGVFSDIFAGGAGASAENGQTPRRGFYSYDGNYEVSRQSGFFVIAAGGGAYSNISNIVAFGDFAPFTPFRQDYASEGLVCSCDTGSLVMSIGSDNVHVRSVEAAPIYAMVEMMDGTMKRFIIKYPEPGSKSYSTFYEKDVLGKYKPLYRINTEIYGTAFTNGIVIENINGRSIDEILTYLKNRESIATKAAGGMPSNILCSVRTSPGVSSSFGYSGKRIVLDRPSSPAPPAADSLEFVAVYANSALVEYLAVSFVNHVENISLKDFPEAADGDVLLNAAAEAYYQNNAYIGGIEMNAMKYDFQSTSLNVEYAMSAAEHKALREAIKKKAGEIAKTIITQGMSDYKKEEAINEYLCSGTAYDEAAVRSMASLSGNRTISPGYKYSQTAYGALINGRGVCQSYAEAFKAIADEAGLDSVVVTGVLNGAGGHAWNHVRLDGEWFSLDTTNNDSAERYNEFFNMPDDIAAAVLTEDKRYLLKSVLGRFKSTKRGYDYYSRNGMGTTLSGLEGYMLKRLGDGEAFNVVIEDMTVASKDEVMESLQSAATKANVGFVPKIYLWVLRIQCR